MYSGYKCFIQTYDSQSFSPIITCLFIFLTTSVEEQMFLINFYNFFVYNFFSYMDFTFGIIFKKSLPTLGSQRFSLLEQESANYTLQSTSGPQLIIVHVLLEYSHTHLFTYCLWLLFLYSDNWGVAIEIVWPRKPIILIYGPFEKMFADLCSRSVTYNFSSYSYSLIQFELSFVCGMR